MAKPQFDEEAIRAALQSILSEINDCDDPSELNELRRIFRSSVPLFRRAYVAGYLLKKVRLSGAPQGRREERPGRDRRKEGPRPERNESGRSSADERKASDERKPSEERKASEDRKAPAAPREDQVTLFVGIGRTRRVFPRDISALLMESCKLEKDDIGIIKILDNYSFVDVNMEKAQSVIDTLNEFEFRGRSLSVNFAKKKE